MPNQYINQFFEEKEIPFQQFIIEHKGQTHIIDNTFTIEVIKKASQNEKETIANVLRQIDLKNGDINHYLQHLSKAYIQHNY